ncbi:hypothetical protein [Methylobacterium brachiatum]|jgi:hypothetical protein|uniref:Uncharacterized protein n=2 Tax=Methylobacterium TaxID=407 RepID=A0AAJ1TW56_9HYPH|nr:hypothetical protein [Methylobacterium brachiatum]MCB4806602.1 hypothetical protein [Methylobacterium brachiatum]MDH2309094.1 hypothetical protein [Methylobacterium brachiatum]MDQ0543633.1 hypothetical protein [Methylobacterium brachiatum]
MRILALLILLSIGAAQAQEADLDWRTPGLVCLIDVPAGDATASVPPPGQKREDGDRFPRCFSGTPGIFWPAFHRSGDRHS